jgi:A/G-specific adenine glycosylase
LAGFVSRVAEEGGRRYRDLPWRRTTDPYSVLVSEMMLQQTQVARVVPYYERWLEEFPTLEALAAAPLAAVLARWQGLGYNRRALALKRLAEQLSAETTVGCVAELPSDHARLLSLPGVGPSTASGVLAFAFGVPAVYLETNVRSVFLHELLADRDDVSDSELRPLVATAAEEAERQGIDPRSWNWALLDYGAHLKRTLPNPSRRSSHHTRQSKFEGSDRQKRARLLRAVMSSPGMSAEDYAGELAVREVSEGREAPSAQEALRLIEGLVADGFLARVGDRFTIA